MADALGRRSEYHKEVHEEVHAPVEVVLIQIILWVAGVIEAIIAIRFFLLLFAANPSAGFVRLVYGISDVFMVPFNAVFNITRVERATFEWSALLAIAVYALVAWGLVTLVRAVSPREEAGTYEREERP